MAFIGGDSASIPKTHFKRLLSGAAPRTRTLSTRTQPSVGPARAGSCAALAAPRPPQAPGVWSKQTARPAKASLTQTRTSLGERALSALNSDH